MRMKARYRAKAQCGGLIPILLSLILFSLPGLSQAACSANAEEWVQKSYIAYYGRPGDPAGIDYWACRMDNEGGKLENIINAFGVSPEFTDRYGALSNSELLDSIYRQMFNRDPDEAGKAWYLAKLNAREMNLQTITLNVLGGATGSDKTIVNNKLQLANDFSNKLESGNTTYRDIAPAKGVLEMVDETSSSVSRAITTGDQLIELWKNPGVNSAYCSNTCGYPRDGACDDGGEGAGYSFCDLGSDCVDCGMRIAKTACNDGCRFSGDGECDDGGTLSDTNVCLLGSDCSDCGDRSAEIPVPDPDPDPGTDDNPQEVTDPEIVASPTDSALPDTAVNVITDTLGNKAVAINNSLGEAVYVILDGSKPVGSTALLGAIYQTADGQLVSMDFNSSGQITRMETNGTVFTYSNHSGNTADIQIDYSDGRHESYSQVSLLAHSLYNQSTEIKLVAGNRVAYAQDPSWASYAVGVVGTSISLFLCGSQAVATGGLTAPIAVGCASAVIGFASVYNDNTNLGYTSAGIDLAAGIATKDPNSIATGIAGIVSGLLGWQTEETSLKAVVAGEVYTTNGNGMIREDNAEIWVKVISGDGNSEHKVTANKPFAIDRKLGAGAHRIRFEAKGYVIKEYSIGVADGSVGVGELGAAPGESTKNVSQINPSSIAKPVVLYLVPELDPAPKITGHVVWPRRTDDEGGTDTERVKGGLVWLEDAATGEKTAWFTHSYVASTDTGNGKGYYELYLPRKSGSYVLKLKQSPVCFQNVDVPLSISGSTASQAVSFDVPEAAFRDAETLNFTFNANTSMKVDIPVVSVYNGTFTGHGTPSISTITYTAERCNWVETEQGTVCELVDTTVSAACESFEVTLQMQDGIGTLYAFDNDTSATVDQCGEFNGATWGIEWDGTLYGGGNYREDYPFGAKESGTGCYGRWTFPRLQQ